MSLMTAPHGYPPQRRHNFVSSSTIEDSELSDGTSSSEVGYTPQRDKVPSSTGHVAKDVTSAPRNPASGLELLSRISLLQGPVVPAHNNARNGLTPPAPLPSNVSHHIAKVETSVGPSYSGNSMGRGSMRVPNHPFSMPFGQPLPMAPLSIPPPEGAPKQYVDRINDCDVLCGRGNRSNCHAGNLRFRYIVNEMKNMYKAAHTKTAKTDLSQAIVEHVYSYGGRFLKKDDEQGKYHILSMTESRTKTSQALRERKSA